MKVILDIPDSKANFIMEMLGNFSYLTTTPVDNAKSQLIKDLEEAVEEMKLIKAGKKQARDADEFLNEL